MKTIILGMHQLLASFEVDSNEMSNSESKGIQSHSHVIGKNVRFTVTPTTSNVSLSLAPNAVAREIQTERINRSVTLGYMPSLNTTTGR